DAAKQTTIHVVSDHLVVIVERPTPDSFASGLEFVGPGVTRTDLIGASAHSACNAKRPRAVTSDTVLETVQVERVWHFVRVQDMDAQTLARLSVNDRTWDSPIGHWFGYITGN